MEESFRDEYFRLEDAHWWGVGRRDAIVRLIDREGVRPSARVLDIGCSGGPLLSDLRSRGFESLTGIDVSDRAIARCQARGFPNTQTMDAGRLQFEDGSFDVLVASDVLEHLADDVAALREWHRVLAPGGLLFALVPAHPLLWSRPAGANQHQRRYEHAELRSRIVEAGFELRRSGWWNSALFPPVALVRFGQRVLPSPEASTDAQHDLKTTPAPVNRLLAGLLSAENRLLARGMPLPFGVSLFAVASRP